MSEIKWRFPGNNYTADQGLDTADMETFKKDAISSLAREICQNSIDAKNKEINKPVKVEFHSFQVDRDKIPGINDIKVQVDACADTWKSNTKISKQLNNMLEQIDKPILTCLRISDFNTTGLSGVLSQDDNTAWHYLVHGSGLSDKSSTSGGSKGIGKFATFVTSHFNTVFYSTKTINGESGYEGICKLCSANQPNTKEKTQGIGYYGFNEMNQPCEGEFSIDSSFYRNENTFGTDIYVIGFKEPNGWKKDIISKTLDSFMAAIVFGELEVIVDEITINSNTIKQIVFNNDLINKSMNKSIVSQYLLLTDDKDVYQDIITIEDYGDVHLYLKEFGKDDEKYATNDCVMIRYPYMKIKELKRISTLPCSALCIIENNKLNEILRDVENPQHTNWEFNRIEDASVKNEVKRIYQDLYDQITNTIMGHLIHSDDTTTDLVGASEYLPTYEGDNDSKDTSITKIVDEPTIRKNKVKSKSVNINASIEDVNGDGVEVDIIDNDNGEEESNSPYGNNNGSGATTHVGDNEEQVNSNPEGHEGIKHASLRGMEYRFICKNKKNREYLITFVSDFDENEAYLELYLLDESNTKEIVELSDCSINGVPTEAINGKQIKLQLRKGWKYTISMITNQEDLFSGEVKMYAYR